MCTSSNAYKVRALAPNPKVALPIDIEAPYRAPLVRGTASLEIVDGVPPEYLEAARNSPAEHPQWASQRVNIPENLPESMTNVRGSRSRTRSPFGNRPKSLMNEPIASQAPLRGAHNRAVTSIRDGNRLQRATRTLRVGRGQSEGRGP